MRPTDYVKRQTIATLFFLCFVVTLWVIFYNIFVGVPAVLIATAFQNPIWTFIMRIIIAFGVLGFFLGILEIFRAIGVYKELKKMVSSGDWHSMFMTDEISKFEKTLWNFPLIGFFLVKRMMPWFSELRHEAKQKRINEIYEDAMKCAKEGQHKLAVEYFASVIRLLPPEEREQWVTRLFWLINEMIEQSQYKITQLTDQTEALENIRKSVPFVCDVSEKLCILFGVGCLSEVTFD